LTHKSPNSGSKDIYRRSTSAPVGLNDEPDGAACIASLFYQTETPQMPKVLLNRRSMNTAANAFRNLAQRQGLASG
jgi:hypothetical protein